MNEAAAKLQPLSNGAPIRARILLAVITLGLSLPFLSQAFHIDDRIYLEIADQIRRSPLFPYDYQAVFEGIVVADAAGHSHLPLTSYYLAAVGAAVGTDREWVYHLAFVAFSGLAVLSFFDLARRFVRLPFAAAALLMISPGFFVLSHTLMAETALVAFWLLALSRFVALCDGHGSRTDWTLCLVGLLGAALCSLLTAGLLLLMAAYWLAAGSPRQKRLPAPTVAALLSVAPVLWLVWYLRAYWYYDYFPLFNTLAHMSKRGIFEAGIMGEKAVSFALNVGGAVMFPPAIALAWGRGWALRLTLLCFYGALVPFSAWIAGWSWLQAALFAVFISCGLLAIASVAASAIRGRHPSEANGLHLNFSPSAFFTLWFFGVFAACLLLYYNGGVRYTLLAFPPLILLWMRGLERRVPDNLYLLRNLVWLSLALTLPYSMWAAYSDYRFAEAYRRAATELVEDYDGPDRQIWFTAEWGLRYYLEKQGARVLPRTSTEPEAGDIILKTHLNGSWRTLYDGSGYSRFLSHRPLNAPLSLRLLDWSSHAGFYSSHWGVLPFGLGGAEVWESVSVFQVQKKYDGPIPEGEKHW